MKTLKLLKPLAFVFIALLSFNTNAQKFPSLDKSPMDAALYRAERNGPVLAKVVYGRPQLNGRDLGTLAPNGKVWRTGANESSEITFYKDTTIGGKSVKAGTYTLFTIPGESEWTIILNSETNTWGSYSYDQSKDIVRVTAPVTMGDDTVEAFAIAFDSEGTMFLGWDKVKVAVPTFH